MVNEKRLNIVFTGIGGQGTVSLGHLLGKIFTQLGYNVVAAETHGMSQRGGSVVFHLRVGEKGVYGSIIPKGTADVIISGEPMEALRVIEYLKPNGIVITNNHGILSPVAANIGLIYPDVNLIMEQLENWPSKVYSMNTLEIAKTIGISKGENLILMGSFIKLGLLDNLNEEAIEHLIKQKWPKVAKKNIMALRVGYEVVHK